ncbi:MAG: hypothetical protein ACREIH_10380, partial [Nitrospiraceae bacterium]
MILQQFPPPYSLSSLQRAANALGLKSGVRDALVTELSALPVPFVAVLRPAAQPAGDESGGAHAEQSLPHRLAIVVKCDGRSVTYYEKNRQKPLTLALEEFGAQHAGKVMLCVPAAAAPKGPDVA